MTILDTFTLDFRTNIPASAQKEVAALDKQIDELGKKGKKRDDDENKRYTELKKQRKEFIDQTKDQQREVEKLGNSFQNMIQGAVGAVTAYASFSALKAGLVDANNLNASLLILQKTYGVNAVAAKAYGAAVERSTGVKAEALYNFAAAGAAEAAGKRQPFDLEKVITNLHNNLKNLSPQEAQPYIQQIPGGAALLPFLQLPDAEFEKAKKEGFGLAGTPEDFKAAIENQEAISKTSQAFGKIATQIDTDLHEAIKRVTDDLQGFAGILEGRPKVAEATGLTLAALGSYFTGKIALGAARSLGLAAPAALATGETASGIGLLGSAGGLGLVGLISAAVWEAYGLAGRAGKWVGTHLPGSANAPVSADASLPASNPASASVALSASSSSKQRIFAFWRSQGYGPGAAAGWTANAQAESSFNPLAGLGSGHVGLYQWSAKRRAEILTGTGIDVANAGLDDQLKAAAWDAQTNYGLTPAAFPSGAGPSAALISNKFEVPSLTSAGLAAEAAHRARIAEGYNIPLTPGGAVSDLGAGRTVNVKIGDIKIETQATDTTGIAREVGVELKNQIRMAMSNLDDGVSA